MAGSKTFRPRVVYVAGIPANAVTVGSVTQTASGSTTGQQTAIVFTVAPPTVAPGDTVQFKSNVGTGTAAYPLAVTFVVREASI